MNPNGSRNGLSWTLMILSAAIFLTPMRLCWGQQSVDKIAFADFPDGVFIVDIETNQASRFSTNASSMSQTQLAPDGTYVAVHGLGGLVLIKLKDSSILRLATDACFQTFWSRDSRKLVFVEQSHALGTPQKTRISIWDRETGQIKRVLQ